MRKKITYKSFVPQILYLKFKRKLDCKQIRNYLKYSNSKRIVPSENVSYRTLSSHYAANSILILILFLSSLSRRFYL